MYSCSCWWIYVVIIEFMIFEFEWFDASLTIIWKYYSWIFLLIDEAGWENIMTFYLIYRLVFLLRYLPCVELIRFAIAGCRYWRRWGVGITRGEKIGKFTGFVCSRSRLTSELLLSNSKGFICLTIANCCGDVMCRAVGNVLFSLLLWDYKYLVTFEDLSKGKWYIKKQTNKDE